MPGRSGLAGAFGVTLTLNAPLTVDVAVTLPVDASALPVPGFVDVSNVAVPPLIVVVAT